MKYTTAEVRNMWTVGAVLARWRIVELAVLQVQAELGLVPMTWYNAAKWKPGPSVEEFHRHEDECGHEMVAFLRAWDPPAPVHIGLTTSDVIDTATGLAFLNLRAHTYKTIRAFSTEMTRLITDSKQVRSLARTHGQPAIITTLSTTWGNLHDQTMNAIGDFRRDTDRLTRARIGGPAGDHAHAMVSWTVQDRVARTLNLASAASLNQVAERNSVASWAASAARVCTAIEAIATVIWTGEQFQIEELYESSPVGSSSMVHKQNPAAAEQLMGTARLARSMVEPLYSGMVHLGQRDLSHSSVERTLIPQLMGLVLYSLQTMTSLLERLSANHENLARSIDHSHPDNMRWLWLIEAQLQGHTYDKARQIASERQE